MRVRPEINLKGSPLTLILDHDGACLGLVLLFGRGSKSLDPKLSPRPQARTFAPIALGVRLLCEGGWMANHRFLAKLFVAETAMLIAAYLVLSYL
jgi:hypothetical protein